MKRLLITLLTLATVGLATFACNSKETTQKTTTKQAKAADKSTEAEVIVMDKALFLKQVFNYEKEQTWKYLGTKPAIIDLYADWCGPCRMVSPIVDEIAEERDDIVVGKINVDAEPELAEAFGVISIPTLVVLKDGQIVNRVSGARPKAQILSLL